MRLNEVTSHFGGVTDTINGVRDSVLEKLGRLKSSLTMTSIGTTIVGALTLASPAMAQQTTPATQTVNAAKSNTPSTSASAGIDKGGGQVVIIDGKEMTFANIAKMDGAERRKNGILGKLKELGQLEAYQEWSSRELEAANQTEKKIDKNIEAANREATRLELESIGKMEAKLARGIKLNGEDRSYLRNLEESKRPPTDELARKILSNPQNFA